MICAFHLLVEVVYDADAGIGHGIGVIIHIDLSDIRLLALQIELVHVVLLRFHHVDGVIVDRGKGAVPIHLGDHLMVSRIGGIHHHDVFGVDGAQAHFVRRIAFGRPVPTLVHPVKHTLLLQVGEQLHEVLFAEFLAFFKRQLEGRALDMLEQDQQVIRVHPAVLPGSG